MTEFPDFDALDLEFAEEWLTVWFNQPEARNPLTTERSADLQRLCAHLQDRRDVRGVVFRGRGGVFCAGGDLKAFKTVFQGGADLQDVKAMSRDAGGLFDAVDRLPQFTVMAIEGAAMAGGLGLACCGDMVIAEAEAKFALTEVAIGVTPAQIASFVMRRLGMPTARMLMLSAQRFPAAGALTIGLADRVVTGSAEMEEALSSVRAQLRSCAPGAVAETKALILNAPWLDRAAQVDAAAASFARCMLSDEGREGVASFVEKRKPSWATAGAAAKAKDA
ncbi:MAG: enoyl-CoA hydratase-related protein [Pseudomonadota bacterium]